VIIKAFGAASIPLNGSTSLTFTIQNNNTTVALTGVAFSDTLPAGLVISTPNGLTGTCGAGTITATAGTNTISLSGGTIAANSSCTFAVNVTGIAAGTQNNTTGNVTSTEGGTGGTASASINVVAPPSIAKVFNPSSIALNATTSLTFTITNPAANAVALTGVAFTDTLPTGLTVANASATVCGGTLTTTAPTGIALTGATIAANSQCQFSVTVTGAAAGSYTNTTGNVTSTNGGTGNTATANLTVATPPTITKAFGASSILVNAGTSLSFTINNPNSALSLTGIAFTDSLPAGLVVSTPNGLTGSCGGGTITAAAGSSSVSLTGATLAASASCTFSVNVTGTTAGVKNNTTGAVSSNESGPGATSNTATITVIGPPDLSKAFGAASINLNATTTLTFTINNPNATVALTGVGFGDTLPAGLVVATPNGLTGSCGAGTITTGTVSGFSVVNLSGGTIAAGGSCTFSVNVIGQTGGHKVNTTGTVTSTNAGSGNQATATIDVIAPDLSITKTHTGTFHRGQTGAQYLITVSNIGFGPTTGTVTVVDTLPNVTNPPVPTAISGTGWTCTLATLTCTRADALASGSAYPVITLTVNIPINIQNNFTNTVDVSGGGDVNNTNNHASDPVSLGPPLVITPHSTTASAVAGGSAQWALDVEDDDPTLGMVTFGCSGLPIGTSCIFNPPSTNQPLTTVTLTISTSGHGHNVVTAQNLGIGGKSPLYAMFFPVLGLVGIALGGRKSRKARLRLAMVFLGMVTLLSFAGCGGGGHNITTPAGTYQITVTAATTTVQASTPVTLTVQ
jgi:fimbrial isopeptide formation D2 family protein